jgi:hypothetical protein
MKQVKPWAMKAQVETEFLTMGLDEKNVYKMYVPMV